MDPPASNFSTDVTREDLLAEQKETKKEWRQDFNPEFPLSPQKYEQTKSASTTTRSVSRRRKKNT